MINPKVPDYGNSIRRLELSEIVHKAKPGENNHCWDDEADEIWSLVTSLDRPLTKSTFEYSKCEIFILKSSTRNVKFS